MAYLHQIETHTPAVLDSNKLYKLLLNAWSAEYALSITPLIDDNDYQQLALSWQLPQAYYAGLFSAKALMFVNGFTAPSTGEIYGQVAIWAAEGMYSPTNRNTLEALQPYAHTSTGPALKVPFHQVESTRKLLALSADEMMMAHERAICEQIGCDEYDRILGMAPDYIRSGTSATIYRARLIRRELAAKY